MGFWARLFGYSKTRVQTGIEQRMDPAIQIEQAMQESRKQDLQLRNQAARVIAHRTELQMRLDRAADDSAQARSQAAQALKMADDATRQNDAASVDKWTRAAQALALRLHSGEEMVESLKGQYQTATQQAELAKQQVNDNAMRLSELSAKRMELVGKLEQAKMQEQVNRTMEQLSQPLDTSGPSIGEIENKINLRMASASARAELDSASIEGAQQDVERSMAQAQAQARLESLREELGIGPAPTPGQIEAGATPAGISPAASEPAVPDPTPRTPADHPAAPAPPAPTEAPPAEPAG
jgi:phage shock protein A